MLVPIQARAKEKTASKRSAKCNRRLVDLELSNSNCACSKPPGRYPAAPPKTHAFGLPLAVARPRTFTLIAACWMHVVQLRALHSSRPVGVISTDAVLKGAMSAEQGTGCPPTCTRQFIDVPHSEYIR